jgi:hypothetical protein
MASKRKRPNLIRREGSIHTNVRLPKSLHREIRRAATKNGCSMHAEILHRLNSRAQEFNEGTIRMLLEEILYGQAPQGQAPQNGRALSQRAPQGRDG